MMPVINFISWHSLIKVGRRGGTRTIVLMFSTGINRFYQYLLFHTTSTMFLSGALPIELPDVLLFYQVVKSFLSTFNFIFNFLFMNLSIQSCIHNFKGFTASFLYSFIRYYCSNTGTCQPVSDTHFKINVDSRAV